MDLSIIAVCDRGLVRAINEDMVLAGNTLLRDDRVKGALAHINAGFHFVAAVADGMGGAKAGEIASQMLLSAFNDLMRNVPEGLDREANSAFLREGCERIHNDILQAGRHNRDHTGMGSTLIALFLHDGSFCYIHVGDSRLYRFRAGILRQLTRDHSLREVTGGELVPNNIIVNSFGAGRDINVEIENAGAKVIEGDIFLLCSDGLSDMVPEDALEICMACEGRGDELLKAARQGGGEDNISYVLVEITGTNEK